MSHMIRLLETGTLSSTPPSICFAFITVLHAASKQHQKGEALQYGHQYTLFVSSKWPTNLTKGAAHNIVQ